MAQRIEAIEGRDGELHLASLDHSKCWRLLTGSEVFSGQEEAGTLLADMAAAVEERCFIPVHHHWHYLELLDAGATVIATLKEDGNVFTYIDPQRMGEAARRWLGEDAAPSGTEVAVNWVAPADRVREG